MKIIKLSARVVAVCILRSRRRKGWGIGRKGNREGNSPSPSSPAPPLFAAATQARSLRNTIFVLISDCVPSRFATGCSDKHRKV